MLHISPFYPVTISPFYPVTISPFYPVTISPFYPVTILPFYPVTILPFYPVTILPFYPMICAPSLKANASSLYPSHISVALIHFALRKFICASVVFLYLVVYYFFKVSYCINYHDDGYEEHKHAKASGVAFILGVFALFRRLSRPRFAASAT
jgi:hypothetical protein